MLFGLFIYVLAAKVLFGPDETITGYAERDVIYELVELNGKTVDANTFIRFPKRQSIEVRSPCFNVTGRVSVPIPWFDFELTDEIEVACITTPFEARFRDALTGSTLVETARGTLMFSNDTGPLMVLQKANH